MHVLHVLRAWRSHCNTQICCKFILWIGRHKKNSHNYIKEAFFVCTLRQTANVFLMSRGKSKSYHFLIVSSITRWTVLFFLIWAHFTFHSVNNILKNLELLENKPLKKSLSALLWFGIFLCFGHSIGTFWLCFLHQYLFQCKKFRKTIIFEA